MSAQIVVVSPGFVWRLPEVQRLWFFPDGSEYLRYSPHFHLIHPSGFRQNMPLQHWASPTFVVVMEGKLSVKNFHGETIQRITVRKQIWRDRKSGRRAPDVYAEIIPGAAFITREGMAYA